MKAVKIVEKSVEVLDVEVPHMGSDDLLVKVASAGLNAADLLQVAGNYPPPPGVDPSIPGLEFAGTVAAVGSVADDHLIGKKVMAIVAGAAQAEFIVVHKSNVITVPQDSDIAQWGAFPEVYTTAFDAIFRQANLKIGERILITGATGGVGSAAIDLAKTAGAVVVASSRSEGGRSYIAAKGALAISPEEISTNGDYDVVLELTGGTSTIAALSALKIGGRIVVIGLTANSKVEIDLRQIMARRATICGSTLRARSIAEKSLLAKVIGEQVVPLVASGKFVLPPTTFFPIEQAKEAYAYFTSSKTGKVALTFDQ
jgi:NADPH:quinone reductase-like Zn-dependent oxidoreductase